MYHHLWYLRWHFDGKNQAEVVLGNSNVDGKSKDAFDVIQMAW